MRCREIVVAFVSKKFPVQEKIEVDSTSTFRDFPWEIKTVYMHDVNVGVFKPMKSYHFEIHINETHALYCHF